METTATVDAELDRRISRRASAVRASDALEPSYRESVRRFNARVRAANREAWCEYHRSQAARHRRNLEALIAHHEAQASKLLEGAA
jgi:hypothetical protein